MRDGRRRRLIFLTVLAAATLVSTSMLAPAFGAPKAVSAASLAKKLARTLTIAKRADRNAKRAIAGLQNVAPGGTGGPGASGGAGPAGPKGDKGDPGTAANVGATGPQGPAGPQGDKGDKGDEGAQGPQGIPGDTGATGATGPEGPQGLQGAQGIQGPPGFSDEYIADAVVSFPVATASEPLAQARTVTCPASAPKVTGGGYSFNEQFAGAAVVLENRPLLGENGWLVRIRNNGNTFAISAGIYAICVS